MARYVLLDAGVIGLACCSPSLPQVQLYEGWFKRLEAAGALIVVPQITCYEVRRELIRVNATVKLQRLAKLLDRQAVVPVTQAAWDRAAEFWAVARQAGKPTAHPEALDADAILAGVATTITRSGDSATIATTNQGHLLRFPGVAAQQWDAIV